MLSQPVWSMEMILKVLVRMTNDDDEWFDLIVVIAVTVTVQTLTGDNCCT